MCQYVPMCPYVSNVLIHTYYLWDWLFIVNSFVCTCPFAPMWPIIWYIPITSKTGCSLWHRVFVCAQWFESSLKPPIHVVRGKFMCQYVPIYPHVTNDLIHTYNLWDWLFIVTPCVCMCQMIWVKSLTSNTCCLGKLMVSMCPCAPMCPMVWYTPITSETGC